jgi:hypothetical protein
MRRLAFVALSLTLCGCSSGLLDFGGSDNDAEPQAGAVAQVAAPAPAAPQVAANDQFCRAVATQDATGHGFDQATQVQVATRSYQQCVNIYTH